MRCLEIICDAEGNVLVSEMQELVWTVFTFTLVYVGNVSVHRVTGTVASHMEGLSHGTGVAWPVWLLENQLSTIEIGVKYLAFNRRKHFWFYFLFSYNNILRLQTQSRVRKIVAKRPFGHPYFPHPFPPWTLIYNSWESKQLSLPDRATSFYDSFNVTWEKKSANILIYCMHFL